MVLRFAVGNREGLQSSSWRLWVRGDDAYLQKRELARIDKFSFHKSGICRWALINARKDGLDRAFRKWKRNPVPEGGSGNGSLLVTIVISTNHLSAPRRELGEKIHWISPAPTGGAVKLDLFLTQEDRDSVERYFSEVVSLGVVGAVGKWPAAATATSLAAAGHLSTAVVIADLR